MPWSWAALTRMSWTVATGGGGGGGVSAIRGSSAESAPLALRVSRPARPAEVAARTGKGVTRAAARASEAPQPAGPRRDLRLSTETIQKGRLSPLQHRTDDILSAR